MYYLRESQSLNCFSLKIATKHIVLFLLCCIPLVSVAQKYELPLGKKSMKLPFKLINNLVVIPMEVNGAKLSFILDSGVSKPLLFNISDQDSVQINNVSEITINGLGTGKSIKALSSKGNFFKMGEIRNHNQPLYVILDKDLNFSPSLGIPIHGIIGYELFRDFVVELNYATRTIKFHDHKYYKAKPHKRSKTLPLTVLGKKAYVTGEVFLQENKVVPVNLLVDTGSSDAIWLFENQEKGLDIPEKHYEEYLGKGLNGNIFGKRTEVKGFSLAGFALEEAKAAFPHMESFSGLKRIGDRNGSLGGGVLKRFNLVFNYAQGTLNLRKNGNFNEPFQYNISGIELQHAGMRYIAEKITDMRGVVKNDERGFGTVQILMENRTRLNLVPEIVVSGIRAGSPADLAGLKEGDLILAVNGKKVHNFKIQEITQMLNIKEGKRVRLLIERYNKDLLFSFVLEKIFD